MVQLFNSSMNKMHCFNLASASGYQNPYVSKMLGQIYTRISTILNNKSSYTEKLYWVT